jgi:hypothetical protein
MIGALLLDHALWRSYASTLSVRSVRLAAYGSAVLKDDLAQVQVPQPPAYARDESEGSAVTQ